MKIIIDDSENNILNFDLKEILAVITEGEKYKWILKDMNFSLLLFSHSETEYVIVEEINNCETEYVITWNNLKKIANFKIKMINGKIFGYYKNDKIEIISFGSYFEFITDNSTIIEDIKSKFKSIRIE